MSWMPRLPFDKCNTCQPYQPCQPWQTWHLSLMSILIDMTPVRDVNLWIKHWLTFITGKLLKQCFVNHLPSSSGKSPTNSKTANQITPQLVSPPRSILVTPRTSEPPTTSETEDPSRVVNNKNTFPEDINNVEFTKNEDVSVVPQHRVYTQAEHNYQGLLDATISTTNWRPDTGSSHNRTLVEIPNNVLSPSSSIASRPPQLPCPRNVGPQNSCRTHSLAYFNCQGHSPCHEERNEAPGFNKNPQRNSWHSASPPVLDLAGPPHLFVYNLHTNNGQHPTDFCMGSSIQHTAVDFVPDEGAYNIRVWYLRPLE